MHRGKILTLKNCKLSVIMCWACYFGTNNVISLTNKIRESRTAGAACTNPQLTFFLNVRCTFPRNTPKTWIISEYSTWNATFTISQQNIQFTCHIQKNSGILSKTWSVCHTLLSDLPSLSEDASHKRVYAAPLLFMKGLIFYWKILLSYAYSIDI